LWPGSRGYMILMPSDLISRQALELLRPSSVPSTNSTDLPNPMMVPQARIFSLFFFFFSYSGSCPSSETQNQCNLKTIPEIRRGTHDFELPVRWLICTLETLRWQTPTQSSEVILLRAVYGTGSLHVVNKPREATGYFDFPNFKGCYLTLAYYFWKIAEAGICSNKPMFNKCWFCFSLYFLLFSYLIG